MYAFLSRDRKVGQNVWDRTSRYHRYYLWHYSTTKKIKIRYSPAVPVTKPMFARAQSFLLFYHLRFLPWRHRFQRKQGIAISTLPMVGHNKPSVSIILLSGAAIRIGTFIRIKSLKRMNFLYNVKIPLKRCTQFGTRPVRSANI